MNRYHRQQILPGIGMEGQDRLTQSKVLIVGLGGLGSPAAMYLAAAGVGTLGLCDMDKVEVSNLHRQIIHADKNIETYKVNSAKEQLLALNPQTQIVIHESGIQPDNALEIIKSYDLIIDGTDNFPTKYLINDAAFLCRKPVVYGSIFQFEGQITLFHPSHSGPCYRCLFPQMPPQGEVPSCAEAGVLGSLCGIIGSLQANEALKWLIGIGTPLIGSLKLTNTLNNQSQTLTIRKNTDCPLCGIEPTIKTIEPQSYIWSCRDENNTTNSQPMEITVNEAKDRLNSDQTLFVDVREDHEREFCSIQPSVHIPLGTIGERLQELPKDKNLIMYCHHGMRSLRATQFLHQQGYDKAINMKGGIDLWSKEIDADVPRY